MKKWLIPKSIQTTLCNASEKIFHPQSYNETRQLRPILAQCQQTSTGIKEDKGGPQVAESSSCRVRKLPNHSSLSNSAHSNCPVPWTHASPWSRNICSVTLAPDIWLWPQRSFCNILQTNAILCTWERTCFRAVVSSYLNTSTGFIGGFQLQFEIKKKK